MDSLDGRDDSLQPSAPRRGGVPEVLAEVAGILSAAGLPALGGPPPPGLDGWLTPDLENQLTLKILDALAYSKTKFKKGDRVVERDIVGAFIERLDASVNGLGSEPASPYELRTTLLAPTSERVFGADFALGLVVVTATGTQEKGILIQAKLPSASGGLKGDVDLLREQCGLIGGLSTSSLLWVTDPKGEDYCSPAQQVFDSTGEVNPERRSWSGALLDFFRCPAGDSRLVDLTLDLLNDKGVVKRVLKVKAVRKKRGR